VRLLQDVQAEQIPGHIYRGYTIISKDCKKNHPIDLQVSKSYIFFCVNIFSITNHTYI